MGNEASALVNQYDFQNLLDEKLDEQSRSPIPPLPSVYKDEDTISIISFNIPTKGNDFLSSLAISFSKYKDLII